jgi:hypothetical protein
MTYKSLIGDMNAKTTLLEDVTVPDDSLFEMFDEFDNQSLIPYMYDYQNLILKGISLIRKSDDLSPPNKYRYRLIDLSKRNNLYIGNNRLPGNDFMKGKRTLNNISLIDYFLLSSPVFSLIKLFDVLDFNPYFLMSTVVCVLAYMLQ